MTVRQGEQHWRINMHHDIPRTTPIYLISGIATDL